jgi:hypothetical protein
MSNKPPKPTNRPPTRKQKEFARIIATEPKTTQTDAYRKAYNVKPTTTNKAIYAESSRTLQNPQVQSELAKYTNILENTLINTVKQWGDHDKPRQREIAQNAVMYMHDKIHGKAKQSIDVVSTTVKLSLDFTQSTPANTLDDVAVDK